MKYSIRAYAYCCLVGLILSPAIASAAEPPLIDANEQAGTSALMADPAEHSYRFTVDPAQSQIVVTATVAILSDSDFSPVSGWLDITLTPGEAPFSTVNITDMDLELTERIDLDYGLFGWARGTGIGITMDSPGSVAPVQIDGSFIQHDNYPAARGTFEYDILGESGTMDLSTMAPGASDLPGLVWQDWTTITLQMDVDIERLLDITDTIQGTVRIHGTIIATAEVFWAPADLYSDGIVNFKDFAVFAAAWPSTLGDANYNPDCDIFDPNAGIINAQDLQLFAENWLAGIE